MSGFARAEHSGDSYWLLVAGYLLVSVLGTLGVTILFFQHPSITSMGIAFTVLLVVLAVASLGVAPAMVMDSRALKEENRNRPRWWRHVGISLVIPFAGYLILQFAIGPALAVLAAGGILVVTTFVAAALYLYERYRTAGLA